MKTSTYKTQIERIKQKLLYLNQVSESNGYTFHSPVPQDKIIAFEEEYGIVLPECYRIFLLEVGDRGNWAEDAGPGPYYGLYPLGVGVYDLLNKPQLYLKEKCRLYPGMTKEYWLSLWEQPHKESVLSGLLPIGQQGCGSVHAIILNGEYTGKVVYLDCSSQWPFITYEKNFLDWYERWLNEEISGDNNGGFGLTMGEDVDELVNFYLNADDQTLQVEALKGLIRKKTLSVDTLTVLQSTWNTRGIEVKKKLLLLFIQSDYELAKSYLQEFLSVDPATVFSYIHWFVKEKGKEWIPSIIETWMNNEDPEVLRYGNYILESLEKDTILQVYRDLAIRISEEKEELQTVNMRKFLEERLEFYNTDIEHIKKMSVEDLKYVRSKLENLETKKKWYQFGKRKSAN